MKKSFTVFLLFLIAVAIACSGKKQSQTNPTDTKGRKGRPSEALALRDANDLLSKGRCADATNSYLQFLQKYPTDPGALNLLGLSYLCEAKHDLAIASFQKALQVRPSYTDVHNNLGVAYMELKNYPEARKEFLIALQDRNYMKAGPYFNLAKLAFSQQSYEESRALAKKAMDLVPKQKDGLPEEAAPLLLYSLSLERLNRLDEAAVAFRDLLKIDSQNLEASYSLATIMARKNQPCVARQYYLQVVDADPLSDLGQKSIEALKGIQCQQ
ncbi:tetratricopeptide repeat protein [bacterium]|nr:tetratricopeptide repeat protein [bacterium]MCI0605129.1 tetratricopeptide repeat protein [bacterium]